MILVFDNKVLLIAVWYFQCLFNLPYFWSFSGPDLPVANIGIVKDVDTDDSTCSTVGGF